MPPLSGSGVMDRLVFPEGEVGLLWIHCLKMRSPVVPPRVGNVHGLIELVLLADLVRSRSHSEVFHLLACLGAAVNLGGQRGRLKSLGQASALEPRAMAARVMGFRCASARSRRRHGRSRWLPGTASRVWYGLVSILPASS